ncbi:hypothetical protein CRG98_001638 [Punica granatum]|uniref:SHSP domain-containing protein n=1 Tax=Punica granatum TaxID=22663 RepID=A0A2I0LBF0_PUNGR|nr:hypothetical protein CRG98_001638 [Punica granatum]
MVNLSEMIGCARSPRWGWLELDSDTGQEHEAYSSKLFGEGSILVHDFVIKEINFLGHFCLLLKSSGEGQSNSRSVALKRPFSEKEGLVTSEDTFNFEKTFTLPENSCIHGIQGELKDRKLKVII